MCVKRHIWHCSFSYIDVKNNLYKVYNSLFGDSSTNVCINKLLDSDSNNGEHSGDHYLIGPFTVITPAQKYK